MNKNISWFLVAVCIVSLVLISCRSVLDGITPANINDRSLDYAEVDLNSLGLIPSLADAKRVRTEIVIGHRDVQLDLKRLAQDDKLYYQDALGFIDASIAESQYVQDIVIGSEDQPFSLLGILAGLTGGAAIGKAMKRKGDYSPEEVEVEIAKAKNGSN